MIRHLFQTAGRRGLAFESEDGLFTSRVPDRDPCRTHLETTGRRRRAARARGPIRGPMRGPMRGPVRAPNYWIVELRNATKRGFVATNSSVGLYISACSQNGR